ncbi:MAG: Flp pilus assembly protein CpaB [Rhodospirillales bacterium]
MSIKGILLISVALVAAVGTALLARNWLATQKAAFMSRPVQSMQTAETTKVLVAKETLEAGRFVRAEDLRWAAWPKDGVSDGYVIEGEAAKGVVRPAGSENKAQRKGKAVFDGSVVRSRLTAGEPITALKLVQPGERGFLAAVLEPGKRAVSVPVDATTGIAGFIFPGDWVDVIFTGHLRVESKKSGAEGTKAKRVDFSETLLSEVRVIAIDQRVESDDGKAKVAKTATLQVTPKQAEKIALGLKMGGLSMSLHSLADPEQQTDRFTEVARAVGALKKPAPKPDMTGSYTLEFDIMNVLSDKRFNRGPGSRAVNVIRADKAEQASF